MQQFREKFLLLSDYLHDVFGAASGDGVTIMKTSAGAVYFNFFVGSVRKWTRAPCDVSQFRSSWQIVMGEGRFELPRKLAVLLGIGLTAGLVAGTGAWQTRPASADQATSK